MNSCMTGLLVLAGLAIPIVAAGEPTPPREPLCLGLSALPAAATTTNSASVTNTFPLAFTLTGPGARDMFLTAPAPSWFGLGELLWTLTLSGNAPSNVQTLVFLKDWDHLWYQRLLPGHVTPGATNTFRANLSPTATGWEPRGHYASWNARALMEPREVGIRVFTDSAATFTGVVSAVSVARLPADTAPPFLRNVRPATLQVPCYGKFEVTFDIPDRYANPFNPEEVSVTAAIEGPDGKTVTIDGFHARQYYRTITPTGEETLPHGPPLWKIRYAPIRPGPHRYTLQVRDTRGTASWGPGAFTALPPVQPGYVRVSRSDPRYFEFDNGDAFFPIGHNIRSPSDSRFDSQFPWAKRWLEGTSAYARYFAAMREHGENMAEIWMAAWSLGLEWSPKWAGYHGVGQYNLMNAWELDQVVDNADRNGIYLNVVIHNHGKFGFVNPEWEYNPFNRKLGGTLDKQTEYFTDPGALKSFQQLMRYIVARWGYSTRVFAWELWSELDLTGAKDFYRTPECVEWHRFASDAIRTMDPNNHLITTHYSGDYNRQNMEITVLPGITHAAVDAYHQNPRPLHIVELLSGTAKLGNPTGKPVLVTEFGGSSSAQGLAHLDKSLHAALWSSTCIPIAGTPMFWWWGLIEEENYYPKFLAVSRFMNGEDRRDPTLLPSVPALSAPGHPANALMAPCLKSGTRALGWICDTAAFDAAPATPPLPITNLTARLDGMSNGLYRVEFWETSRGELVSQTNTEVRTGALSVDVPAFSRDTAFKVRRQ